MCSNRLLPAWVQSWMFDSEEELTGTPSPYSSLQTGHLSTRVKITPPKLKLSHARESQPVGHLTPMPAHLIPSSLMLDTSFSPVGDTLSLFNSSTAPNGSFTGAADILAYSGDTPRKSSSETRNSSSPDENRDTHRRKPPGRPTSKGTPVRKQFSNGLLPFERVHPDAESELPSMLEENITGTRLSHPNPTNNKLRNSRPAALKPLNSSDHTSSFQKHQRSSQQSPSNRQMASLSISGLGKPEGDDSSGAGWTHSQNNKIPTVTKPPTVTSHQNNSNNSNSAATTENQNSSPAAQKNSNGSSSTNGTSPAAQASNNAGGSGNPRRSYRQSHSNNNNSGSTASNSKHGASKKSSADAEPKYADPLAGSSPSFQARLSELASLEAETVRYERLRKIKKKSRDKDD